MRIIQRISVEFNYDVTFTRGVFELGNDALSRSLAEGRALAFIDDGLLAGRDDFPQKVARWFAGSPVKLASAPVILPGGERIKSDLDIVDRVGSLAEAAGLDRHSYIVMIGGGALLDAVGFAASVIHRGLRQIRLPTTALSQADSGVGVKNGLNRFGVKNFYGAFAPPHAVVCDTDFLTTLERRDMLSGVAEAVKVGVIKDASLIDMVEANADKVSEGDADVLVPIVTRSAEIHLDHIATGGDPFESGSSRPLDFGHWAAHWLESATDYDLRHGEAVAIGIAVDLICARELGMIGQGEVERVLGVMKRCGLGLWHNAIARRQSGDRLALYAGLGQFREHLGGRLTLAMPDGLGRKKDVYELAEETVECAVDELARSDGE